jgi:hypothetical protein
LCLFCHGDVWIMNEYGNKESVVLFGLWTRMNLITRRWYCFCNNVSYCHQN